MILFVQIRVFQHLSNNQKIIKKFHYHFDMTLIRFTCMLIFRLCFKISSTINIFHKNLKCRLFKYFCFFAIIIYKIRKQYVIRIHLFLFRLLQSDSQKNKKLLQYIQTLCNYSVTF